MGDAGMVDIKDTFKPSPFSHSAIQPSTSTTQGLSVRGVEMHSTMMWFCLCLLDIQSVWEL
jgi:hypothetical protein